MYEKILVACFECNGQGVIETETDEGPYSKIGMYKCHECNGSGELYEYIIDDEAEQD